MRAFKVQKPLEVEMPIDVGDGMPPLPPSAAFPGTRPDTVDLNYTTAKERWDTFHKEANP